MENTSKAPKSVGDTYIHQISILRSLYKRSSCSPHSNALDLSEIAELSGLRDEKETQRYLFILEGQKLVSPAPPGDLTSKTWHITNEGQRAMRTIIHSNRTTQ